MPGSEQSLDLKEGNRGRVSTRRWRVKTTCLPYVARAHLRPRPRNRLSTTSDLHTLTSELEIRGSEPEGRFGVLSGESWEKNVAEDRNREGDNGVDDEGPSPSLETVDSVETLAGS